MESGLVERIPRCDVARRCIFLFWSFVCQSQMKLFSPVVFGAMIAMIFLVGRTLSVPDYTSWNCNGPPCNITVCNLFNRSFRCMPLDCEGGCEWHKCEHVCLVKSSKLNEDCSMRHDCGQQQNCPVGYVTKSPTKPSACERWLKCVIDNHCLEYTQECKCPPQRSLNHPFPRSKVSGPVHDEL